MSNTPHTQGSIRVNSNKTAIVHSDDGRIACPPNHSQRWAWDENSRRLVACWNACDGIDTGLLEGFSPRFLANYPDKAMAERNELAEVIAEQQVMMQGMLDALKELERIAPSHIGHIATAAIAKATGVQHG